MIQIECNRLKLGYEGRTVLSDLSFTVEEGSYLCIVGENGSGKSTLMKTLLNIIPPVSGTVSYHNGVNPTQIGYLPQQTPAQKDFPASVSEVILSGFQGHKKFHPFYSKTEKAAALDAMRKLGISDISGECYRNLSGGQQQRVLLARCLCAAQKVILLDEPVSGLDPMATTEMYGIINELNKKDKITVIMITHDVASACRYADHILHIGSDIFYGTTDEYLNSEAGRHFCKTEAVSENG